jgi:hypothetical protein
MRREIRATRVIPESRSDAAREVEAGGSSAWKTARSTMNAIVGCVDSQLCERARVVHRVR